MSGPRGPDGGSFSDITNGSGRVTQTHNAGPQDADVEMQGDRLASATQGSAISSGSGPDAGPKPAPANGVEEEEAVSVVSCTYRELAWHWFVLGWTAFGGPAAHVAMFQKVRFDCVERGGGRCC